MKTWFAIILCCCVLLSCDQPKTIDYKLLEGDWIFPKETANENPMAPVAYGIMPLSLRTQKGDFVDSLYKMANDTLFIKIDDRAQKGKYTWYAKFIVKNLTKDSLKLFALRDSTEYTLHNSDLIRDTSIHVNRICFTSSGCYGSCPVMNIEINENGTVYYEGLQNTPRKGNYLGFISPKTYGFFEELIQKTDLEKLDSVYDTGGVDNQASGIKIFYNNGKIKSIYIYPTHGFDLPFINLLTLNLMHGERIFELKHDELRYSFGYNRFRNNFKIPLPIPIITTEKFTPPVVE